MRLTLDATSLLGARTGVGVFTHEVLTRFAADPNLAVSAFAVTWRGRGQLGNEVPANVRVVNRPMAARPLRRAWTRHNSPPIEWWTGRVDVVFGPNFVVPPSRHAAEVVTVHDLTCVRFPDLCTADTLAYPGLIRRAINRGAWIHTVSNHVADEVRATFVIDPDRVVAIPNGFTTPRPASPSDGHRLAGGAPYVLGLGTIEPRKDFPLLVQAFDEIAATDPDLRLVIAGADGWGVDAFDAAVAQARHRDRIVRLHWVDDAQRAALVRGAAVFAFPSLYEGFGLPPLEAMAAGVPVVASSAGALPETLGAGAVLVAPGDRDALAEALTRVLHETDDRAELIVRATKNLERFSWDRTAVDLVALFDQAHGDRHRR